MTSRRSSGSMRRGERRRTDKVGKHHCDLAALGGSRGPCGSIAGCGDTGNGTGKLRNRFQQLLAMAERHDADVLEIVVGQLAQQLDVDVVGAEHLGILRRDRSRGANRRCPSSVPWLLSAAVFEKG